jgi:hypothetical protein
MDRSKRIWSMGARGSGQSKGGGHSIEIDLRGDGSDPFADRVALLVSGISLVRGGGEDGSLNSRDKLLGDLHVP